MLDQYTKRLEEEIKEKDKLIKRLGNMLNEKEERIDNTIEYINNSMFFYQNKDIKRDLLLLLSGIIVRSDKK